MGLFDFLKGSRATEAPGPDELRSLLFDAAAKSPGRLAKLCRAHSGAIVEAFPSWQKLPEEVRADPAATQRYMHGLIGVAQTFAQVLGRPELMQRLMGPPESNPLVRWQQELAKAQALVDEGNCREAAGRLSDLLIDVQGMTGSGPDKYLPITYGHLGNAYFQGGEAGRAVAPLEKALELCRRNGDAEGVAAYLGGLYEVHRYLGEPATAAEAAERLAEDFQAWGRPDEADAWRRRAHQQRAGEPPVRVLAEVDGRMYEIDEAPAIRDGGARFFLERNRVTLRPSQARTERGRALGSEGRYDEALAAFREAAEADRFDPQPHYNAGWTLLLLGRPAEAVEEYEATEARAPGWYHCRADLWLARELALGRLEHEAFLALGAVEDSPEPVDRKLEVIRAALTKAPSMPLLHLHAGRCLAALGRRPEAEAAYRRGLDCAEEPDTRTRLLVDLGCLLPPGEERDRLLREAVALGGNLVAAATATLVLKS
jgi:tetratricopeptide (TPR) repeat protein